MPPKKPIRKSSGKGRGRATSTVVVIVFVAAIIAAGLGFLYGNGTLQNLFGDKKEPARDEYAKVEPMPPAGELPPPAPVPPPSVVIPSAHRVAIVIDDMGQTQTSIDGLLALDLPITFAVLPHLKYSVEAAHRAHEAGRDVILHAPMEPKDTLRHDAGQGVLLTTMSEAEVRKNLENDLKSIPHVIGVNNHMGSKFTENERQMKTVIGVLRDNNLFFLDSRTTAASVGTRVAREMGVRNAGRQVFLDNEQDVKYIKGQIAKLIKTAKKDGSAIAIGHPYKETITALRESAPELEKNGIEVVRLSELIK